MNLPIPTLPTDNLYKFMALSGLAILIFSLVFPVIRMSEIKLKMVELEIQGEILKIEKNHIIFESNKTVEGQKWMVHLDREKLAKLSKKELDYYLNELILQGKDLDNDLKRMIEVKKKFVELEGRIKLVEVLNKDLRFYLIFLMTGGLLGSFLCSFGFGLWYVLVQRPNDLLLKTQVEQSRMKQEARQKEAGHGDLS